MYVTNAGTLVNNSMAGQMSEQNAGYHPSFWGTNWGAANMNPFPYAISLANSSMGTFNPAGLNLGFNNPVFQSPSAWTGHHHTAHMAPSSYLATSTGMMQPRMEMAETNSDVVLAIELPNVSPSDINLTVTDDSVSISGMAQSGHGSTSLYRTIPLPTMVRSEQVNATYAGGVLEVRLPKADVIATRRIRVNPLPA